MRIMSWWFVVLVSACLPHSANADSDQFLVKNMMPYLAFDRLDAKRLSERGGEMRVAIAPGAIRAGRPRLLRWVAQSGRAVAVYFGRFPVKHARVLLVPVDGSETSGGQAFGNAGAAVRLLVGTETTDATLTKDWQLTHEIVHLAFPNVQQDTWLSEGMAVYVEPIARVQAGDLKAEAIWAEYAKMMPTGLPKPGDKAIGEAEERERIYWGGAMFWLTAELEIRSRTQNRIGVQDALRGVLKAGGTIEEVWSSEKALKAADEATAQNVLLGLYKKWMSEPQSPDLDKIWQELGVKVDGDSATFDDGAPLAAVRQAITARPGAK